MKKLIAIITLLAGSSPAMAHTLSFQEGVAVLYHQLLGMHHLPLTLLLIVLGVAMFRGLRKRVR
jgi:hypothetical protein